MEPPRLIPEDLAPGDARVRDRDASHLRLERIDSPGHPLFARAHDRLWREFGASNEMERREVIAERLTWDPRRPIDGHHLRYELLAVLSGDRVVALRDHTAVVPPSGARALVHLSHVLVEPELRGTGLSGWLRAVPLQAARACVAALGLGPRPITLVGEMEHDDGVTPAVQIRRRSYARAGFLEVDRALVRYAQPDFRPAAEIEATSVQPVPLALIVRRVGAEAESHIPAGELHEIVTALYTLFAAHQRHEHMRPLWRRLAWLPAEGAVPLVPLA